MSPFVESSGAHSLDLDGYLARIGHTGPRDASLEALQGIVAAHTRTIPFENLDVLRGRGISLEPAAIERKLVGDRRGGYCFEQNGLLLMVLEALGFRATPLGARVRLQRPRDYTPPRTHLFLRVEIDGVPWLADVGIGGLSPTAPIRLELDVEQTTPHEPRRIVREGDRFFHQARLGGEWADVYEFTLEEMPPIDRELANWFTSTHPESHFRHRLMVARAPAPGVRLTLLNDEFTVRRVAGGVETTRRVNDADALLDLLAEQFGLHFPPGTRFGAPGVPWPV
jgi:N-hydroxyarylamine O-acetyltransferase